MRSFLSFCLFFSIHSNQRITESPAFSFLVFFWESTDYMIFLCFRYIFSHRGGAKNWSEGGQINNEWFFLANSSRHHDKRYISYIYIYIYESLELGEWEWMQKRWRDNVTRIQRVRINSLEKGREETNKSYTRKLTVL